LRAKLRAMDFAPEIAITAAFGGVVLALFYVMLRRH
jgi:hypothetical protein